MRGLEDGDGVPVEPGLTSEIPKDMVFDSSEIKKRDSSSLFTNVEGQAERDKENAKIEAAHLRDVERRRKDFQKKMHAKSLAEAAQRKREFDAQQRAEEKARHDAYLQEKKRERKETRAQKREQFRQGKFYRAVWGGWHKIVTIFVALAIIIGTPLLYIYVIQPANQEHQFEKQSELEDKGNDYATSIRDQAKALYDGSNDKAYEDAVALFESELEKNTGVTKFYIGIYYSNFLINYATEYDKAVEVLDSLAGLQGEDKSMTIDYYATYRDIYTALEDTEMVKYYNDLMLEVDTGLQEGPIEGIQGDE